MDKTDKKEKSDPGAFIRPPENKTLCMAPWTHTYISPQSERRLCCASREEADFIHQYIDQPGSSGGDYNPSTLEEHWNSEHLKSVRRRMLKGETLPECELCNEQSLHLFTYRKYFTEILFPKYMNDVFEKTDETGFTTMKPISFDYRLNNHCDFKCRMCGEQLSSSWESEKRQYGDWNEKDDPWMLPSMKKKMENFQKTVVEKELQQAVDERRVEEIYWVGGEPLVWDQHWNIMNQLVRQGDADKVFVRYNTNLGRVKWKDTHLFHDVLKHFKDFNLCASIDSPGKIGEYIRTGLNWESWLENFKTGLPYAKGPDSMVFDVTLTLPGLFGMKELLDIANELDVKMYVKTVLSFDPSIVLSPFALPRELLHDLLDDLIEYCEPRVNSKTQVLVDTFKNMKNRKTFMEQYPDNWRQGYEFGKIWIQRLAERRGDGIEGRLKIEDIYSAHPGILKWWEGG